MKEIGFKDSVGKNIKIGDICYKNHSRGAGMYGLQEWLNEFVIVRVEEGSDGFWFRIIDKGNCTDGYLTGGWSGEALTRDPWIKDGNCVQLTIIGNRKTPMKLLIKRVNKIRGLE